MIQYLHVNPEEESISKNHVKIAEERRQAVHYHNKVCTKPWGYEYLVYQNKKVAIWFLCIHKGHATSLHCHFKKDTLLTTLHGIGKITLIDNTVLDLPAMESIFIPRKKFHALSTFSDQVYFLEMEIFGDDVSFSDKNDLLRIHDVYQRGKTGYESSVTCLEKMEELTSYGYFNLNIQSRVETSCGAEMIIHHSIPNITDSKYILLQGSLYQNGHVLKEGSVLTKDDLLIPLCDDIAILEIHIPYYREDAKIIYDMDHLQHIQHKLATAKKQIVLTSGCYDIIHVGHLHHLKCAKQLGDVLMVCLSSDSQIKALKGPDRPINQLEDRMNLFKTISYVDYIVLYNEENIEKELTLGKVMKVIKPSIWTKGDDYTADMILSKHPYLSKVVILPNISDKSTTSIISKIKST
jgi:rfaE bifunctional protein nucleotidyltransferase chain/domain